MDDDITPFGKILIYQPATPAAESPQPIDKFKSYPGLQVDNASEAFRAVLGGGYDLVVTTPQAFSALQPNSHTPQLSAVLDAIGQGVCIVEQDGGIVWSNSKLGQFPEQVRERIQKYCIENYSKYDNALTAPRPRTLSFVTEGEQYFEAMITPIVDPVDEHARLLAVVSNVTRARRLQQKMDAIDNAGRELVRVDADQLSKMDVRQRLELLERKIIRYTRELLHFDNFAIRLLDKNTNRLELVLCAGLPVEAQNIDIYATTENSGISGYVAATGRSYICSDVEKDPRYLIGIDNAKSSLTVPLRLHDQVIGVLNIESDRMGAFSEDERQFAEIFARYVAIALHILDLLVVERHTTTGRLADDVSAEISGPLSDILADATTLMEDYIGHDDLRHRLQAINENVVKIKESIKQVTQPVGGILGSKAAPTQVDPLLEDKLVLVVDDEEIIRRTVQDVLVKYGCEVETARDGTEALAMVNQRSYDLVISDIRMPGHNGYEIFQAVKDTNADCPVIFMTGFGYDPHHCIIRANTEGLAAVLYKPFKVDQLLSDVRAAVAAKGSKKQ
jgi:two-component system, sensor histidine kinase SagS